MYANGWGIARDYTTAYMWAILSVARTDPSSPDHLKRVKFRDRVSRRLTAAQIAEAAQQAQEWEKQHPRQARSPEH
jgi:hypothetical protein